MSDYFFIDNSKRISWQDLLDDLNSERRYNPYCLRSSQYDVFKHIILSLLLKKKVILLDSDFSRAEIEKLIGNKELSDYEQEIDFKSISFPLSKVEMIETIQKIKESWSVTLFTSGTTGLPKKITHSFRSITRNVKSTENHRSDVWGFAYNPTHMAGIQVFFQALLNGNTLVNLLGLSRDQILASIKSERISNISATPTFYRLLLPMNKSFESVQKLTSGGEKFDPKTFQQLQSAFPNARITNVYASTEAGSVLATDGNLFSIKPGMENLIKIENNELLIHRSLMGQSELNTGEWYHTGDLVKPIPSNGPIKFEFVSRKNEMINVGGYKVNPSEVEETIREIPGIRDTRVFAKENAILGKIVFCEVVKTNAELDEPTIRKYLQTKLQEYKIPRMIKFVEKLATTRTGKIKRN